MVKQEKSRWYKLSTA